MGVIRKVISPVMGQVLRPVMGVRNIIGLPRSDFNSDFNNDFGNYDNYHSVPAAVGGFNSRGFSVGFDTVQNNNYAFNVEGFSTGFAGAEVRKGFSELAFSTGFARDNR